MGADETVRPAVGLDLPAAAYDGLPAGDLARALGVPALHLFARVGSTMDAAHAAAAAGAAHGTLVLADTQTGGRGRAGRTWASTAGTGVWLTVIARVRDPSALEVLSLRVGLELAVALQPLASGTIQLKWPNDLLIDGRKLAGVLVEARWRDGQPEWAAIGIGTNVRPPVGFEGAAALGSGVRRVEALSAVVHAARQAADASGLLSPAELQAIAARDSVAGREVLSPVRGRASGVSPGGALLILGSDGVRHEVRQTTVTYATEPGSS